MISIWSVYHIPLCCHAKPKPKNKFVVIFYTDPEPHGFFINSTINNFIKNRPYLLKCEPVINKLDHNFLSHSSYVDCRDALKFHPKDLTDFRGVLSIQAQKEVTDAIMACPVLSRKHKKRFKSNIQSMR